MTDLVGKTVTTGKRNQIQNDGMAPKNIDCCPNFASPYKPAPVSKGKRDTVLDAGGSKKHPG